jgi:hypothetical protein
MKANISNKGRASDVPQRNEAGKPMEISGKARSPNRGLNEGSLPTHLVYFLAVLGSFILANAGASNASITAL